MYSFVTIKYEGRYAKAHRETVNVLQALSTKPNLNKFYWW